VEGDTVSAGGAPQDPGTPRGLDTLRGLSRGRKIVITVSTGCLIALVLILTLGSGGGPSRASSVPPPAAKAFTLHALGHPGLVSLRQYAGRPVIVNFFASFCGPCKKETPLLARFYRARHGQVAIVGVDVNDGTAAAMRFVRSAGVSYPVGADPTAATATGYGVIAIPQTFFLNAAHHVVKRVFGAVTPGDLGAGLALMR
jgi:thiol-disulfide isomerase/thioredoxin